MQRRQFLESMGGATFALLFANACGDSATDTTKDSGTEGHGTGGGSTGGSGTGGNATGGGGTGSSSTGGASSDANGVTGGTDSGQQDAGMEDAGIKDAGTMAPACAAAIVAQITCRHNHKLEIRAQDLTDGVEKVYDIRGTNLSHGHDVTVTTAHCAALKRGETVMIAVPSRGQPHTVHLSCAAGWKPAERDNQECN